MLFYMVITMTKPSSDKADVVIIGGGVVGTSIAYSLSCYDLRVILLEKDNDVSLGATRANSGIVHAGYDPIPESLMARLNVEGNRRMSALCKDLDVPFETCGSLVISRSEEEDQIIQQLYERGIRNGVPELKILSADATLDREPYLTRDVHSSLFAPSAGIVMPWTLCIAMAEVFARNGGEIRLETCVSGLNSSTSGIRVQTNRGDINARFVVNAAGLFSDEIHNMADRPDFKILPSRGEYYLLEKNQGKWAKSVIFSCPSPITKGVLVARTAHGNLIVGPTSETISDKEDTSTTAEKLHEIREKASSLVPCINFSENIRNYSGIRANSDRHDFIIRRVPSVPGLIDVAGIKSPGLAASPAIGPYVVDLLRREGLQLQMNSSILRDPNRLKRKVVRFHDMSPQERASLISTDTRYARIVCRCETVTEGEIRDAIHAPLPARTIDAIKRRTDAGLGRCQGGFCAPRIAAILAEELHIKPTDILQDKEGSYLFTGPTKIAPESTCDAVAVTKADTISGRTDSMPAEVKHCALAIIGAGPAGLAAASKAYAEGITDIIVFERDKETGGILNQCIHTGFGLRVYNETLTGPEYAERAAKEIENTDISIFTDTMVLDIRSDRLITAVNRKDGLFFCHADAIILAMGCRERTRGAIAIPGSRPSGIWTAGTAQRYMNIEGCMIGSQAVILGSGDIGLIMARRLMLEGIHVKACVEVMPEPGGLSRNIAQCLEDFNIPLLLSHTVTEIKGKERLESVVIAQVDSKRDIIVGTEKEITCDTLLLSVGLIPENELTKQAGLTLDKNTGGPYVVNATTCLTDGFFACGNVLHVHDLVDDVTLEAHNAAYEAAAFLKANGNIHIDDKESISGPISSVTHTQNTPNSLRILPSDAIRYVIPQYLSLPINNDIIDISFRVRQSYELAEIIIRRSDKLEVYRERKSHVKPGEMQKIHFSSSMLMAPEINRNFDLILDIAEDN